MQRDLDRYRARHRRMHRVAAILLVMLVLAFVLVLIKSYADRVDQPFDSRFYRPVDRLPPDWQPE